MFHSKSQMSPCVRRSQDVISVRINPLEIMNVPVHPVDVAWKLLLALEKSQKVTKVIGINSLAIFDVCSKFNANTANSYWDILLKKQQQNVYPVWTMNACTNFNGSLSHRCFSPDEWLQEWQIDIVIPRATLRTSLKAQIWVSCLELTTKERITRKSQAAQHYIIRMWCQSSLQTLGYKMPCSYDWSICLHTYENPCFSMRHL